MGNFRSAIVALICLHSTAGYAAPPCAPLEKAIRSHALGFVEKKIPKKKWDLLPFEHDMGFKSYEPVDLPDALVKKLSQFVLENLENPDYIKYYSLKRPHVPVSGPVIKFEFFRMEVERQTYAFYNSGDPEGRVLAFLSKEDAGRTLARHLGPHGIEILKFKNVNEAMNELLSSAYGCNDAARDATREAIGSMSAVTQNPRSPTSDKIADPRKKPSMPPFPEPKSDRLRKVEKPTAPGN